jgi:hypothetical protein
LVAPKLTAWRTRRILNMNGPSGNDVYVYPNELFVAKNLASAGNLDMLVLDPYNAGNVGPDTCPIIMSMRFVNFRSAEYRPPWSLNPQYDIPFL